MTFETNKPGTYKLASNNTLTFTLNDVVVTDAFVQQLLGVQKHRLQ